MPDQDRPPAWATIKRLSKFHLRRRSTCSSCAQQRTWKVYLRRGVRKLEAGRQWLGGPAASGDSEPSRCGCVQSHGIRAYSTEIGAWGFCGPPLRAV